MIQKSIVVTLVFGISVLSVLPVYAKNGGSNGGQHKDITVTKTTNKSSPKMMMQQTGSSKTGPVKVGGKKTPAVDTMKNMNDIKGESKDQDHKVGVHSGS